MCTNALFILPLLAQIWLPAANLEAKARAQSLLTEGSRLYEGGEYADALAKFDAAYAALPSPKLMFNIGQANRALGRPVEALKAFENFLRDTSDSSSQGIDDARKYVTELQGTLGRIIVHCETPEAEVSLDGTNVGRTPLTGLIWASPGRHQVTASKAPFAPALDHVEVKEGATSVVTLRLLPIAQRPRSSPMRIAGWTAAGLGLAGIGVGIATGLVAWSEKTDLESKCPANRCSLDDRSAVVHYSDLKLASTIAFAAGGACLVTGVILLLVAPSGEQVPDAKVAFGIGPGFGQLRIRF